MSEARFGYETRDFLDAYGLAARVAWRDRKRWLLVALVSLVGVGILTFIAEPQDRPLAFAAAAILMPLGSVIGFWLSQKASVAINGRQALKTQPVLREEFIFEIRPDSLVQRSKHGETIVAWSDLKAFSEGADSWLLYPDFLPHQFYVLPKRKLTPEFAKALGDKLQAAGVARR